MTAPLFSILIAQYNNGRYFKNCYDSIVAQTYKNWEVIIVDDGSTDNSVMIMKEMIGDDARFRIEINKKNEGCGYTKRRCTELATGEICGFLDPDDAITEEALELMVAEHDKYPEAAMIYSKPFWCDENLKVQYIRESEQIENGVGNFFDLEGRIHHFLTFKKSFYDKTTGISAYLQRAIDKDLVLKLYETGPAVLLDQPLYKYRIHTNSISMNANIDKAYFWYWVTIIDAAKRRNVNIENLFIAKALKSRREVTLEKEIARYNRSFVFKALRKIGLF